MSLKYSKNNWGKRLFYIILIAQSIFIVLATIWVLAKPMRYREVPNLAYMRFSLFVVVIGIFIMVRLLIYFLRLIKLPKLARVSISIALLLLASVMVVLGLSLSITSGKSMDFLPFSIAAAYYLVRFYNPLKKILTEE